MNCLDWWRDRCLEHCHDRLEHDRFADQKYLDAFSEHFPGVHSVRHPGVNLAPWNLSASPLHGKAGALFIGDHPVVAYHFQGVKGLGGRRFDCALDDYGVRMSAVARDELYLPYLRRLHEIAEAQQHTAASTARAPIGGSLRARVSRAISLGRAHLMGSILRV